MPKLGEIEKGRNIGQTSGMPFIWVACEECGKERWVRLDRYEQGKYHKCRSCSSRYCLVELHKINKRLGNWKGGRSIDRQGYVHILIEEEDDFFASMRHTNGYVLEHRLVIAKKLGRCLQAWEIVHHKGVRYQGKENKSDNLEDNLELTCSLGEHSSNHSKGYRDGYQRGLTDGRNKQIQELKQEIKRIKDT